MHNDTRTLHHHMIPAAAYYLGCAPVAAHAAARQAPPRFKSLASMLPSLLMSGLVTLLLTGLLRLFWVGFSHDFTTAWMEAWLISWPIIFPLVYLLKAPLALLAALMAARKEKSARDASLSLVQIADASDSASAVNGLSLQCQPGQSRY